MTNKLEFEDTIINQMRQAVTKRDSYMFSLSGSTSDFRITLPNAIELNRNLDYEIALIRFEAYNSLYNITSLNNNFRYFNGNVWKNIIIPPGAYEVVGINNEIQRQMKLNNDVTITNGVTTYYFNLYPNLSTLRSIIDLTNNYQVDFTDSTIPNNLRNILGYNAGIYSGLYNQSQNIIMIQTFDSIFINCDLCTNSYLNNNNIQALRSFTANSVPVGYKVIIEPSKPIWLPLIKSKRSFNDYHVWISDENGNIVSFNGETINLTLWLRSV